MKFSVFDLDRTLLSKNSSFEFCKYLYRNRFFSFFFVLKSVLYYMWHQYFGLTLEGLHRRVFRKLLHGIDLQTISQHVAAFVEHEIENLLYLPALERLRRAQHEGHYTMILSNSPSFLVGAIASRLQVDDWKASEYQVDQDQKLCRIAQILHGNDKASWVRKMSWRLGVREEQITAYSDSHLDLPFLESAGRSVVVNPDSRLKKISKKKNWEEI